MSQSAEHFAPDSSPPLRCADRFLRPRLLDQLATLHGRPAAHRGRARRTGLAPATHSNPHQPCMGGIPVSIAQPPRTAASVLRKPHGRYWTCDDLVGLVQLLVRNRSMLDGIESGWARLGGLAMRGLHALRANTRDGARRNIAAHYDLGNDFFGLFLSDDLMYSSALYAGADDTLEQASARKLDRICEKLRLEPGDQVIEIGTGWGGFALHAARHYGCHVTTTTISREQHALASARVAEAGLQDRVTLLLEDYRDLRGQYDKLVSIEMIEAIGAQFRDTTSAARQPAQPDGLAVSQASHRDNRKQALRSSPSQRHVSLVFHPSSAPCGEQARSTIGAVHLEELGLLCRTVQTCGFDSWRPRRRRHRGSMTDDWQVSSPPTAKAGSREIYRSRAALMASMRRDAEFGAGFPSRSD